MAHVLLVEDDPTMRHLLHTTLEIEGHAITEATDLWEVLMVLRASLHPLVVVYSGDVVWRVAPDQRQAYANALAELRQHRYIELAVNPRHYPRKPHPVYDQLAPEVIPSPIQVTHLLERVQAAADSSTASP
jgi:CheY-like chemotaxis protein